MAIVLCKSRLRPKRSRSASELLKRPQTSRSNLRQRSS
ncbi:unnamed protein product [Strongylus vulgaris]|uniref:Uncharacterized protein n=1 Tax=Strongylus vulgaris TaxID=40348 RepID=A0A3P7IID9_STRVU|nr:unnamed protein product [Strongylus vulgaris]